MTMYGLVSPVQRSVALHSQPAELASHLLQVKLLHLHACFQVFCGRLAHQLRHCGWMTGARSALRKQLLFRARAAANGVGRAAERFTFRSPCQVGSSKEHWTCT